MAGLATAHATPWVGYLSDEAAAVRDWWAVEKTAFLNHVYDHDDVGATNNLAGAQTAYTTGVNAALTTAVTNAVARDNTWATATAGAFNDSVAGTTGTAALEHDRVTGLADARHGYESSRASAEHSNGHDVAFARHGLDTGGTQQDYDQAVTAANTTLAANLEGYAATYTQAEASAIGIYQTGQVAAEGGYASALATADAGRTDDLTDYQTVYLQAQADARHTLSTTQAGLTKAYSEASANSFSTAMAALHTASQTPWSQYASSEAAAFATHVAAVNALTVPDGSGGNVSIETALADAEQTAAYARAAALETFAEAQQLTESTRSTTEATANADLAAALQQSRNAAAVTGVDVSDNLPGGSEVVSAPGSNLLVESVNPSGGSSSGSSGSSGTTGGVDAAAIDDFFAGEYDGVEAYGYASVVAAIYLNPGTFEPVPFDDNVTDGDVNKPEDDSDESNDAQPGTHGRSTPDQTHDKTLEGQQPSGDDSESTAPAPRFIVERIENSGGVWETFVTEVPAEEEWMRDYNLKLTRLQEEHGKARLVYEAAEARYRKSEALKDFIVYKAARDRYRAAKAAEEAHTGMPHPRFYFEAPSEEPLSDFEAGRTWFDNWVIDPIAGWGTGHANVITFGLTNWAQRLRYGDAVADYNQSGLAYNIGTATGIAGSIAMGYGAGAASGSLAATGGTGTLLQAWTITGDVVGVAQSSYNVVTDQSSASDALGFLPTVGWAGAVFRNFRNARLLAPTRKVSLGIEDHLDDFSRRHGADSWKVWAKEDPMQWKGKFYDVMNDPKAEVLFNLDGVDVWGGVTRASRNAGGATDWELLQIYSNKHWWSRIKWIKDGKAVPHPFE